MSAPFMLDPDYRNFIPAQTPLKFTTLYRGGCVEFAMVAVYCICAALLLVFSGWAVLTMGEINALTIVLLVACLGFIYLLRWGWHEARRYYWAARAFPLLQAQGTVLEGKVTKIQRRTVVSRHMPAQHFVDVFYMFTSPDGRTLTGQQSNQREDLRNARLPAIGTPVRVLWAGEGKAAVWVVL